MKVLVAYDGTLDSKTALRYVLEKIKESDGELIVLYVFTRELFIDYDALPGAEEAARKESSRYVREAEAIIQEEGKGVKASIIEAEGNQETEIIRYAHAENIDLLLCPPRYKAVIKTFGKLLEERGIGTSVYAYSRNSDSATPSAEITLYGAATFSALKFLW